MGAEEAGAYTRPLWRVCTGWDRAHSRRSKK